MIIGKDLGNSVIFPVGEVFESEHFIGTVHLHMLTGFDSGVPIGNVTFEPGCRNSWHAHPGGQILLVTGAAVGIGNGAKKHRSYTQAMW